ncbi:8-oxo-dGTP diphosphatase [Parendozoicomonas haliclonae]|uniref:Oxidized purine nucleoside triphosphate hydrolase n=1 Tax=Parendozoicomonas haliclonae TaxID=1960125 RepID=A0A1X7APU3_9GAMM|nr:8-oxo-dGTP diphosphatase [Parendozoicomonas haliclonae]SMA50341.1 8-oxo-dGTP diphosphatase [Parendozoicomonas haliclonae]
MNNPTSLADIDWDNWQPTTHATLLFVIQDGKILLIRKKRGLGMGKINGPGGKLDPGETLEQCASRELQEELLITPGALTYHGDNLFQFVDGLAMHVHIYTTNEYTGTPTETDEAEPLWFDLDKIPYEEMWEDDYLWIPMMLEGKDFTGRFLFDNSKMLDYALEEKVRKDHMRKENL